MWVAAAALSAGLPYLAHDFNELPVLWRQLQRGTRHVKLDLAKASVESCLSLSHSGTLGPQETDYDTQLGCLALRGDTSSGPHFFTPFYSSEDLLAFLSSEPLAQLLESTDSRLFVELDTLQVELNEQATLLIDFLRKVAKLQSDGPGRLDLVLNPCSVSRARHFCQKQPDNCANSPNMRDVAAMQGLLCHAEGGYPMELRVLNREFTDVPMLCKYGFGSDIASPNPFTFYELNMEVNIVRIISLLESQCEPRRGHAYAITSNIDHSQFEMLYAYNFGLADALYALLQLDEEFTLLDVRYVDTQDAVVVGRTAAGQLLVARAKVADAGVSVDGQVVRLGVAVYGDFNSAQYIDGMYMLVCGTLTTAFSLDSPGLTQTQQFATPPQLLSSTSTAVLITQREDPNFDFLSAQVLASDSGSSVLISTGTCQASFCVVRSSWELAMPFSLLNVQSMALHAYGEATYLTVNTIVAANKRQFGYLARLHIDTRSVTSVASVSGAIDDVAISPDADTYVLLVNNSPLYYGHSFVNNSDKDKCGPDSADRPGTHYKNRQYVLGYFAGKLSDLASGDSTVQELRLCDGKTTFGRLGFSKKAFVGLRRFGDAPGTLKAVVSSQDAHMYELDAYTAVFGGVMKNEHKDDQLRVFGLPLPPA